MSSSSGLRPHTEQGARLSSQVVRTGQGSDRKKNASRRPLRAKSKTAPPASYPVQRSLSMGCCLVGVWCLAVLVSILWVSTTSLGAGHTGFAQTGVLVSLMMSGGAAYVGWRQVQPGLLRWDGEVWEIEAPTGPNEFLPALVGTLSVQFDFQFLLLLRLDAATDAASINASGLSRWIWLDQSSQPGQWPALRRAVFSPKPSASNFLQRDTALNTEVVV